MDVKYLFLFLILALSVSVRGQEDEIVNEEERTISDIGDSIDDVENLIDEADQEDKVKNIEDYDDTLPHLDEDSPVEIITDSPQLHVRRGAYQLEDGLVGDADDVETDDAVNLDDEQNQRQLQYPPPTEETENGQDPYGHIDGRYLPPTSYRNTDTPYVITNQRLNQIRGTFLYWFYDRGGDENIGDYQRDIHASSPQIHKNFNFQLPFFGFRFNYTRVSVNGYLQFSDPPDNYRYPLRFPVRDWPTVNDPSFIGIFFSKCRIGNMRPEDPDQRRPGVYFRMDRDLQARTDQLGVEMRERVSWDIREGVIGSETFFPKHAVTVTWKNMSFAGGIDNSLFVTNTFQMVLATDEVFTYAIFNYVEITWSAHTEAGGDTTGGEGGVPAYIGFNAGNGTRSYEYQPYSQASVLRDLTHRGWANGFPGRHIFRIDENILMGTCNKDIDGANLPLMFAPESGNMLGGTVVNITGPCFSPLDRISCRFDTEWVVGVVVDVNRAVCIQPRFYHNGYARFEIAINNEPYKWKGRFFVETPATASEKIFFTDDSVHQRYPPEVRITWDRFNLTTNQNLQLQISLWGYREVTTRPHFEHIDILEVGVANTGEFIINPQNFRNRDNFMHLNMQFGFLQINLTSPSSINGVAISPILWSRPIPLGWYFAPQWERRHGQRWAHEMCNDWLRRDRFLRNFASRIWVCPCTMEHALLDKGRYMPDWECDRDSNPTCRYHWGGIHCVRSGSPSFESSGQQCCYDKNGFLMLSYDQMWGSRPHRSHDFGFTPYNEANKVPSLSHWHHDMIPYYQCCLWQEEQAIGCETFRFERRPSQDCVAYQAPGVAGIFGDPHIVTFDDLQYTFNGKGEFVLVRVNRPHFRLDVQGRFEQVPRNIWGPVNATHLTSIAASSNQSIPIEVRLRPQYAQWRYRLDVFADGKRIYFDRPSLRVQYFPGVTVYQPTYILNQSEIIIMFSSGAGVEVLENKGFMTARVYLPWDYVNQTRGLFGNWSFDVNDDFARPDGQIIPVDLNNFRSAHVDFAEHWRLTDREQEGIGVALFAREFGRTAAYYNNDLFVPNFIREPANFLPANRSQDIQRATELCQDSYQCRYDFGMTLNRDMAEFTKNYLSTIINIKETNARRVISCGILETPRFGRKSNFFFTPGTTVQFECNQDFILIGDVIRRCQDNGRWNLPDYGFTECLRHQEYSSRTLGWTWAIITAVMLPILVVLICLGWRILKRKKAEEKEETYPIRTRPIDPDESMKINSDDDSLPYKKVPDTPLPEDTEKVTENDHLATTPSPGFQYEATQPLTQTYPNDQFQPLNSPESPFDPNQQQNFPGDLYPYNTGVPYTSSPTPYNDGLSPLPQSPTAIYNPASPAPSNPGFSTFYPTQDTGLPSPQPTSPQPLPSTSNQKQNQPWSGETEIN